MPGRVILVGKAEIAERLEVTVKAVERWMATPSIGFPEPDARLGGRREPVWQWRRVKEWSRKSGYPRPLYNRTPGE